MAPIAWSDVTAISSPLASVDPTQQTLILAWVNTGFSQVFDGEDGPKTKLARIYVAAHFASLPGSGDQRPGGAVTSESRGGLSRSYAPPPTGSEAYEGTWGDTQWGRRYLQLLLGRQRHPREFDEAGKGGRLDAQFEAAQLDHRDDSTRVVHRHRKGRGQLGRRGTRRDRTPQRPARFEAHPTRQGVEAWLRLDQIDHLRLRRFDLAYLDDAGFPRPEFTAQNTRRGMQRGLERAGGFDLAYQTRRGIEQ